MTQEVLKKEISIKITPFAYGEAGKENTKEIINLILKNNKVCNNPIKFNDINYFWNLRAIKDNHKKLMLVIHTKNDML